MTRYLLDTNIISNSIKLQPSPALEAWMIEQVDTDLFTSAWTLAEIKRGILQMPTGRKREGLEAWYAGSAGPPNLLAGRVLPFDEKAAEAWAEIMADGHLNGHPRSGPDMLVAAVAIANDCLLVTDNERHFAGVVPLINPMR